MRYKIWVTKFEFQNLSYKIWVTKFESQKIFCHKNSNEIAKKIKKSNCDKTQKENPIVTVVIVTEVTVVVVTVVIVTSFS